jgi:hypothetical protein
MNVTDANFAVTPATADVKVTGSGTEYTVTLLDYEMGTTYTISTQNIEDEAGLPLAPDASVQVTTEAMPVAKNILADWVLTSKNDTAITEADGYKSLANANDTEELNMAQWQNIPVAIGDVYEVSALVKADSSAEMKIDFSLSGGENNKTITKTVKTEYETVDANWKRVTAWISIGEYTGDDADPTNAARKVMHVKVVRNGGTATIDVKDAQMRKLASLDIDASYKAVVYKEGNVAHLAIAGGTDTIYFSAAKYAGTKLVDVKFGSAVCAADGTDISFELGDGSYSIFIWDSNMKPLNTVISTDSLR